ncbi:MAG: hypothetical protein R3F39_25470 [Myxococcota bacterium]
MPFARLIPLLLLLGGLTAAADPVVNLVKAALTTFELSSIVDQMHAEWTASCTPPPTTEDALADFIDEAMRSRGSRRASDDFWGMPYQILEMSEDHYVVYSTGANRTDDACGVGVAYTDPPNDPEVDAQPSSGPDDVCVDLHLPTCQSAYRNP